MCSSASGVGVASRCEHNVGSGLVDELLKNATDPLTGHDLGCWNTVNTTNDPEDPISAEDCLFDLKAQSYQSKVITDFIDVVDSGVLRILEQRQYDVLQSDKQIDYQDKFMPFIQTDLFVEEVSNLKLETNGKNLQVKKAVNRMNKDRWSAVAYAIFYIMEFENDTVKTYADYSEAFAFRAPRVRM